MTLAAHVAGPDVLGEQRADGCRRGPDGRSYFPVREAFFSQEQGGPLLVAQALEGFAHTATHLSALDELRRVRWLRCGSLCLSEPCQLPSAARDLACVLRQVSRHAEQPPFHVIRRHESPYSQASERLLTQ